jgi:hypothetical protein
MVGPFLVLATPALTRLAEALAKRAPEFPETLANAAATLAPDSLNIRRERQIKKLVGPASGEGQYRLRVGRWRFRYDVHGRNGVLHHAGLRRENTYR